MSDTTTPPVEADARRPRTGTMAVVIAVLFGLLYAYDLWEAVGNAIELPRQYAEIAKLGIPVGEVPWTLIVANMLVPPVVFVFALVLGRGRGAFARAVLFAVGLALVAVLSLDIIAIA